MSDLDPTSRRIALVEALGIAVAGRGTRAGAPRRIGALEVNGILGAPDRTARTPEMPSVVERQRFWQMAGRWSHLLTRWDATHPNERSGDKLALRAYAVDAEQSGRVRLTIQRTDWRQARAAQEYLEQLPPGRALAAGWSRRRGAGAGAFPNILAVHCIVETADGCLLLNRRNAATPFYPLHWSASLEEGVEPSDLAAREGVFDRATRRGIGEELTGGDPGDTMDVLPLGVLIEASTGSPAVAMYARLPISSKELAERSARAIDREESTESTLVPFAVDALASTLVGSWSGATGPPGPWHPTSVYRILAAMVLRFGWDACLAALDRGPGPATRTALASRRRGTASWPMRRAGD